MLALMCRHRGNLCDLLFDNHRNQEQCRGLLPQAHAISIKHEGVRGILI